MASGWEPKVDVRDGLTRTIDWFAASLRDGTTAYDDVEQDAVC